MDWIREERSGHTVRRPYAIWWQRIHRTCTVCGVPPGDVYCIQFCFVSTGIARRAHEPCRTAAVAAA